MKRRQFINTLSSFTGGLVFGGSRVFSAESLPFEEVLKSVPEGGVLWNVIRKQFSFPKDYIYLNTGGIGAVPNFVINKMNNYMYKTQIKPRPAHNMKEWWQVKENLAGLLSPSAKREELALVSTASEGINIILNGLPLEKGDEIIISRHEHAALNIPLANRMQLKGIRVKIFDPDFKNGLGNVERIEKLITKRTKLIFVSHVTCTTGQRFPLKEIGELAKAKKLWFAVDGAQAVGHQLMDIKGSNVDFYTFSGHKWCLGPKRTGVLFVRDGLLDVLKPTVVGTYSDESFDLEKGELVYQSTAQRYEYATQNPALFWGLGKAVDFIKTIGVDRIQKHNNNLAEKFYRGLKEMQQVKILSPEEKEYRTSIISFKIKNKDYKEVGKFLTDKNQIRVRIVPEAGVNGVRVSFHVYNNEEEVIRTLETIKKLT